MRIDAHQHFWSRSRGNDYGFLTKEAGVLYNEYLPEDLAPLLGDQSVKYTITVQAAPSVEETEWLLALTESVEFVIGVVGWVDFDTDTLAFRHSLERFIGHSKWVGVRPMLQDLGDDQWILRPKVLANVGQLADLDIPFEILVYPRHLPSVSRMLKRIGGLRAVLNHGAKPHIKDKEMEPWASSIREISEYPTVYCKLSGLVTEADPDHWTISDLIPYVHHIAACFGPDRLLFGSDWPVCLKAASYGQVVAALEQALPSAWGEQEREMIFYTNAVDFYKLRLDRVV